MGSTAGGRSSRFRHEAGAVGARGGHDGRLRGTGGRGHAGAQLPGADRLQRAHEPDRGVLRGRRRVFVADPCGDPPAAVGGTQTPPTAEGGALRSQDVRTTADPTGRNGAILRVGPATGAGPADDPFGSSADANRRRIVAYGPRNPFRFTIRPARARSGSATSAGTTGRRSTASSHRPRRTSRRTSAGRATRATGAGRAMTTRTSTCARASTPRARAPSSPYLTWSHAAAVVSGGSCPTGSSSVAGLSFFRRRRLSRGSHYTVATSSPVRLAPPFIAHEERNNV
jgi:hypothetical protein